MIILEIILSIICITIVIRYIIDLMKFNKHMKEIDEELKVMREKFNKHMKE